jgi:GH35 family endo-1,4-beta-xylanase
MKKPLFYSQFAMLKLMLLVMVVMSFPLHAQQIPDGGDRLVTPSTFLGSDANVFGAKYGAVKVVEVKGMPFDHAVEATTAVQPEKYYHIGIKYKVEGQIKQGDSMLCVFYARSLAGGNNDTGGGMIHMNLNMLGKGIGKAVVAPNAQWMQYFIPFKAEIDSQEKRTAMGFSFGAQLQTIQIADIHLINYGRSVSIDALPVTKITYKGREADAAWRQQAQKRIEQIRMATMNVSVKDASGSPIADAKVTIEQQRHAFWFGCTLNVLSLYDTDDAANLRKHHKRLFNMALCEGSIVWSVWENPKRRKQADELMQYYKDNGYYIRAHVLVWEKLNVMPKDMRQLIKSGDKDAIRKRVSDHIREIMTTYKGMVDEWVVENEAVDNSELRDVLGKESIAEWFKIAREVDPDAKLMFNENRTEGLKPDKSDRFLKLAKIIEENGGPLDTFGIQGHTGEVPIDMDELKANFDKLAAYGKPIAITEFDIDTTDEQLKADYMRDYMTMVFSHPAFYNFTVWKWWTSNPARTVATIYNTDWTMKPSGQVYENLVFNTWWTKASGNTSMSGEYQARGFLGDYQITVSANGQSKTINAVLTKDGKNNFEIRLP